VSGSRTCGCVFDRRTTLRKMDKASVKDAMFLYSFYLRH
jgi:hypothetical protein